MPSTHSERIIQLQTNLDDMNPQLYEGIMDRLFQTGALDVTLTPAIMKRSRPGTILSVVAFPQDLRALTSVLFSETSTLGIRIQELGRAVLPRTFQTIRMLGGSVRMKIADLGNGQTKVTPEYRDCLDLAQRTKKPVQAIIDLARQTFSSKKPLSPPKHPTKKSLSHK